MLIWCSNRQVSRHIFHIFHLEHHQKSIIFNVVQRIIFLINCTDYNINPFDYETEDKYLEALAKAKLSFLPPSL